MAELRAWMEPAKEKLDFITTTQDLTPEDRVKEIFDLQAQVGIIFYELAYESLPDLQTTVIFLLVYEFYGSIRLNFILS